MTDIHPVAAYMDRKRDNMLVARLFREAVDAIGNQNAVAELFGITAGQVSHILQLELLPQELHQAVTTKRLTFKVAKALAPMTRQYPPSGRAQRSGMYIHHPPFSSEQLISFAQAFMDKQVSSVHLDAFIRAAKHNPTLPTEEILDMARNNRIKPPEPPAVAATPRPTVAEWEPPVKVERPPMPTVRESAIQLQAALRVWQPDGTIETMLAESTLKRLLQEIQAALTSTKVAV